MTNSDIVKNADPHKIRILHLEDHPSDAEAIARILKKADINCEFQVIDTREQYVKALAEFKPEIVLSDHSLPAFNSMEALDILKRTGNRIPFILVTGAVSEEFAINVLHEAFYKKVSTTAFLIPWKIGHNESCRALEGRKLGLMEIMLSQPIPITRN